MGLYAEGPVRTVFVGVVIAFIYGPINLHGSMSIQSKNNSGAAAPRLIKSKNPK